MTTPTNEADVAGPTQISPSSRRWFEGLNGLRFVAAFSVLIHHAAFSSGATFRWDLAGAHFARLDIGVSIFFVLSGFLLYRPFVVAQFAAQPPPHRLRFWIRRLVRIFPAYWVAFLVMLALGTITVVGVKGFLASFTLTHIYVRGYSISGIPQAWSLSTELGFYFLLPFIAAGARRLAVGRDPDRATTINRQALRLLAVCGGLAIFSVVFRVVMAQLSPYSEESWGTLSRLWTPSYLDIFAAGMALAVVSAWADQRTLIRDAAARATTRVWLWWAFAAGAFWFVSTQIELERGLDLAGAPREIVRQTLYGLIAVAVITPAVLHGSRPSLGLRVLAWPPIAWLGLVSYGIYLWQTGVLRWAHEILDWPELTGSFWVLALIAFVGSTAIAALSHRFVEDPASRAVQERLRRPSSGRRRAHGERPQ